MSSSLDFVVSGTDDLDQKSMTFVKKQLTYLDNKTENVKLQLNGDVIEVVILNRLVGTVPSDYAYLNHLKQALATAPLSTHILIGQLNKTKEFTVHFQPK